MRLILKIQRVIIIYNYPFELMYEELKRATSIYGGKHVTQK